MNIKISILVPVYRIREEYLRRCVESLCGQTLTGIQIILVDDGSPDECGSVCDEYAETDPRITVIHQENKGLAAARNTAFDRAVGKYIMFLDGDDYLEANACEEAYQAAETTGAEVVFWDILVDYSHESRLQKTLPHSSQLFEGEKCRELQERVLDFNGKIAQVFAKLIQRDFLIRNQIRHVDELRQGAEGLVYNLCLFEYVKTAYYLDKPLNHYTYHEGSISHSYSEGNIQCIISCFEYMKSWIAVSNHPSPERLRQRLYERLLYVVCTTAVTGYFNPYNGLPFHEKCTRYRFFLDIPLIDQTMKNADRSDLSRQRKVVLWLTEKHLYIGLSVLGRLRRLQMKMR